MAYPFLPIGHKDLLLSETGWDLGVPENVVHWMISVAGWKRWQKRWKDLVRQVDLVDFPNRRLLERHYIEIIVPELYEHLMKTGRLFEELSVPVAFAIGFCHSLWVIQRGLSDRGRRRFEGSIKDALNRDFGFSVLRCEIGAILQLLDAGYKVAATDWEGLENFDFLACSGKEELEVECKVLTHGTGDRIKPKDCDRLLRHVRRDALLRALAPGRTVVCRIVADSVLPTDEASLKNIVAMIISALRHRLKWARRAGTEIFVEDWNGGSVGPQGVFPEARRLTQVNGWPTVACADGQRGVILAMESRDKDPKAAYETSKRPLKEAVSQLSGARRSCLFVNIENLGPYDQEHHMTLAMVMQSMIIDVGKGRPELQGLVFGLPGEPFSGGETLWLWNPARKEGKEEPFPAFERLWRTARLGATPEFIRDWRKTWEAQWK